MLSTFHPIRSYIRGRVCMMLGPIMSGTEMHPSQSTKTADCLVTSPASLAERHGFVLRISRDRISPLTGRGRIGFFFPSCSLRASVGEVDAPPHSLVLGLIETIFCDSTATQLEDLEVVSCLNLCVLFSTIGLCTCNYVYTVMGSRPR